MQNFLPTHGDYIDFEILPIHSTIQLSIIRSKSEWDSIVKQYDGAILRVNNPDMRFDSTFMKSFPFYDFNGKAKFYQLSNGYIAVDQSQKNKSNPYYLCSKASDHDLVCKYLSIFYIDESLKPIVKCSLYEHFSIKRFIESEHLQFIREKSDDIFKLFIASNGQYVHVKYSTNNTMTLPYIDQEYKNELEVYHSFTIFESLEIMNLLDEF